MPTTSKGVDLKNLNPGFAGDINALIAAVESAGGKVTVTSGYRTRAQQEALYNSGNGGVPVAKPGTSDHERGEAADLTGDAKTMKLLHQYAPQFGISNDINGDPVHFQMGDSQGVSPSTAQPTDTTPPSGPMALEDRLNAFANIIAPATSSTQAQTSGNTSTALGVGNTATTQGDTGTTTNPNTSTAQPAATDAQSAPNAMSAGSGDITSFMNAIAKQESHGDYNATNKDSGAHGKYQIMPSNWSSWAQEAGLPANAPQTPDNQERVARAKIQQYYNQFGNWHDVAVAWYAGPGAVGKNGNASQGNYPSINQYASDVTHG